MSQRYELSVSLKLEKLFQNYSDKIVDNTFSWIQAGKCVSETIIIAAMVKGFMLTESVLALLLLCAFPKNYYRFVLMYPKEGQWVEALGNREQVERVGGEGLNRA